MKAKPLPTQQYLRECFDYDLSTGVLTWRVRPRAHFTSTRSWRTTNTRYAGKEAGLALSQGHRQLRLDGCLYRSARVIWKWVAGQDPIAQVDHVNVDPADDRWSNLRLANQAQNGANAPKRRNNKTGFRGVYFGPRGRYVAAVRFQGKRYYAGSTRTAAEAHQLYCNLAAKLHGQFHHP